MFNKILVPLDGSKLAECALKYAEALALNSRSEMLALVSVTERVNVNTVSPEVQEQYLGSERAGISQNPGGFSTAYLIAPLGGANSKIQGSRSPESVAMSVGKMEKQADKYLRKIADPLEAKGIPVITQVLIGNVAQAITRYAEDNDFDTIVMSSHGRSGPSRWALGSVSEKVFRASCIPVFMVRAPGCFQGI